MAKNNNTNSQTFIEINGRRYDPRTGEQIHAVSHLINDVVQTYQPQTVALATPVSTLPPLRPGNRVIDDVRPVRHLQPHQPEHAKTLMRSAVKPPTPGLKKQLKVATRTDILAKSPATITVATKLSFHHTDPKRLAHAARVSQSELVRKFAVGKRELTPPASAASADKLRSAAVATHAAPRQRQSMDIFEKALAKADAHTEKPVHPKKLARAAHKAAKKGPISQDEACSSPYQQRPGSLIDGAAADRILRVCQQNLARATLRLGAGRFPRQPAALPTDRFRHR